MHNLCKTEHIYFFLIYIKMCFAITFLLTFLETSTLWSPPPLELVSLADGTSGRKDPLRASLFEIAIESDKCTVQNQNYNKYYVCNF